MLQGLKRFLKRRVLPFFLICFGAIILFIAVFWLKCAFMKPSAGPLPTTIAREQGTFVPDIGAKKPAAVGGFLFLLSRVVHRVELRGTRAVPAENPAQRISACRFDC